MRNRLCLIGLGMFVLCARAWPAPGDLYATRGPAGRMTKISPDGVQTPVDGLQPYGLTYDSAGNLYASDFMEGFVWKFAPDGRRSIYASGLTSPGALAFDRASNRLYVATSTGIIIIFPNNQGASALASVVARGLAFDKSGNLLVTTGNLILSYPKGQGPASTVTDSLIAPNFLAVDAGGSLYVGLPGDGSPGNGSIFRLGFSGSTFASGLNNPQGLAFDSMGNLFEVEPNGAINKFTPAGVKTPFSPPNAGFAYHRGLAFDTAGHLLVADGDESVIYQLDGSGNRAVFAGLNLPQDIAFDAMGSFYVADYGLGMIFKYMANGTRTIFASGLRPVGLAVNSAGNLYETDQDGSINKFSPNGAKTVFVGIQDQLDFWSGLDFDSSDNLFVIDKSNSSIIKFDPSGARTTVVSGLHQPFDLAIGSSIVHFGLYLYETDEYGANLFTIDGQVREQFAYERALGVALDTVFVYLPDINGTIYKYYDNGGRSIFATNVTGCRFLAFEPAAATLSITGVSRLVNGHCIITGKGAPKYTYSVQYSADLSSFTPIPNATATANAEGVMQYDDSSHLASAQGFYRFSYP